MNACLWSFWMLRYAFEVLVQWKERSSRDLSSHIRRLFVAWSCLLVASWCLLCSFIHERLLPFPDPSILAIIHTCNYLLYVEDTHIYPHHWPDTRCVASKTSPVEPCPNFLPILYTSFKGLTLVKQSLLGNLSCHSHLMWCFSFFRFLSLRFLRRCRRHHHCFYFFLGCCLGGPSTWICIV